LWLAGRDVEVASIDGWDGETTSIRAAGFPSGCSPRTVVSAFRLLGAIFASWRELRRSRPDVVLGMGSYASVGPVLAARLCHIPVVLHEANAVPGRAISFLSRFATYIGIGFEAAAEHLPPERSRMTGFPLRSTLERVDHVAGDTFTLLVMGGSQGAHVLNETVPQALEKLVTEGVRLRVIHLAGLRDADAVEKRYRAADVSAEVHAFASEMPAIYAATDFAVARAGAATCTELAICGIPALLIPLPSAPRNHQALNAMAMATGGGMAMHLQQDLTVDWLVGYLKNLINSPDTLATMRSQLNDAVPGDGTARLASLVEGAAGEHDTEE